MGTINMAMAACQQKSIMAALAAFQLSFEQQTLHGGCVALIRGMQKCLIACHYECVILSTQHGS